MQGAAFPFVVAYPLNKYISFPRSDYLGAAFFMPGELVQLTALRERGADRPQVSARELLPCQIVRPGSEARRAYPNIAVVILSALLFWARSRVCR